MINVLEKKDNFNKINGIKSNLLFGAINKSADFTMVIPIYGMNKFLKDVLMNLKRQEPSGLIVQIIISDNKPELESNNEIIDLLKKVRIPDLAYFCSEMPLGMFNNFNRAISLAETEYVGMVHDDDLVVEDYYSMATKLLKKLKSMKRKVGMIHAKFNIFYDDCKIEAGSCHSFHKITNLAITQAGTTTTGIPSCGTIFDREAVIAAGGFNDEYSNSGDAFLAGVMLFLGYDIFQFDQLTGYYRIAVNTSLKLNVCQGFIREDEMFRDCWRRRNPVRFAYMTMLQNYYYSRNIDGKVASFSKLNPKISVEVLDFRRTYKKYHRLGLSRIFNKMIYIIKMMEQKFYTICF